MDVKVSGRARLSEDRPVPDKLETGAMPCSRRTSTSAVSLYGEYRFSFQRGSCIIAGNCPKQTCLCPNRTHGISLCTSSIPFGKRFLNFYLDAGFGPYKVKCRHRTPALFRRGIRQRSRPRRSMTDRSPMPELVITAAKRTAIGGFLGSLKDVSAVDLGVVATQAILPGLNIEDIADVIVGIVLQAGNGMNPARQIALKSGLPDH